MLHLRNHALLAASILAFLPGSADARPAVHGLCSSLLANPESGTTPRSPEQAIADAWSTLFLREGTGKFTEHLSTLLETATPAQFAAAALNPDERVVEAPSFEAVEHLRDVVALLAEQGALNTAVLHAELLERTRMFNQEVERQRQAQDEQKNERKSPPEPVRIVHTGGSPQRELIRLSTGGFAIAAGREAFIVDADGSNLRKVPFTDDFSFSLIEGRDGSLVTVSQNAMLYRFDRQGVATDASMLAGTVAGSPLELRDGRIVVGNIYGALFIVAPNGDFTADYGTDGTISSTPIQLSTNGNIVVTSHDACVHFLDEAGNFLNKTCADYAFELSPIELSNGIVFAVNARGKGYLFNREGTVLTEIQTDSVSHAPVQGPGGRIALATDEGKVFFLDDNGAPTGITYEAGAPLLSPPTRIAGNRLAFSDVSKRIHVIDWDGNQLHRINRPERITAPIRDAGENTLVVATETGDLLFIDLRLLAELER